MSTDTTYSKHDPGGLDIVIEHEIQDPKGSLTILKAKIKDKNYYLVNVYGPNKDAGVVRFYHLPVGKITRNGAGQ